MLTPDGEEDSFSYLQGEKEVYRTCNQRHDLE